MGSIGCAGQLSEKRTNLNDDSHEAELQIILNHACFIELLIGRISESQKKRGEGCHLDKHGKSNAIPGALWSQVSGLNSQPLTLNLSLATLRHPERARQKFLRGWGVPHPNSKFFISGFSR